MVENRNPNLTQSMRDIPEYSMKTVIPSQSMQEELSQPDSLYNASQETLCRQMKALHVQSQRGFGASEEPAFKKKRSGLFKFSQQAKVQTQL